MRNNITIRPEEHKDYKVIEFFKNTTQVYAESDDAFWDDEHISKYMLEAHLNPDCDSASRKQEGIVRSVDWITELCDGGSDKKLLDLGCGPGIYAELLCDKGFQVTGVDFSKRSISYAKESANSKKMEITYHYQNYLDINYDEVFDVIILIYCDFGVLSPENRRTLLDKICQALKPGGKLILDVFNEPWLKAFEEMQDVHYEQSGFWSPEPHVVMQQNKYYEETRNTLEQYLVITEKNCKRYYIWNQIYSKEALQTEVTGAGLEVVKFFDDVQGKEYTGQADTLCGVFQKG